MAPTLKMPILVVLFTSLSFLGTARGQSTNPGPTKGTQILDLTSLSGTLFAGQETERFKALCRLEISPIGRDFGGRLIQDYKIQVIRSGVDRTPLWERVFRLRGPNHFRTPTDTRGGGKVLVFEVSIEGAELQLTTSGLNTKELLSFEVATRGSLTAVPRREFTCNGLKLQ
jgi:hypothetical protein